MGGDAKTGMCKLIFGKPARRHEKRRHLINAHGREDAKSISGTCAQLCLRPLHGRTNKGMTKKSMTNNSMTSNTATNNTNSTDTRKSKKTNLKNKSTFLPCNRLYGMVRKAGEGFLGRCRLNLSHFLSLKQHIQVTELVLHLFSPKEVCNN